MLVNRLNIITAIINRIAARTIRCGVSITSENRFLKTTTPNRNIQIKLTNKILLSVLKGTLMRYRSINPVNPVSNTAKVETSSLLILITSGRNVIINILHTIVKAVGNDFFRTFMMILPFILSLFGSKASMNDGIPMVTILVRVS